MNWNALHKEFDRDAVSWRAQSVSKKDPTKPKAMALAYIDARDVMDRLDSVCGPSNWQDAYIETAKGRLICTLSIRVGGEWVAKSDGAGNTDVEGDKGAISDALKRAAVKWGIGRYLYAMPTPWVPCELYNDKWSKWADDPWKYVRNAPAIVQIADDDAIAAEVREATDAAALIDAMERAETLSEFRMLLTNAAANLKARADVRAAYKRLSPIMEQREMAVTP